MLYIYLATLLYPRCGYIHKNGDQLGKQIHIHASARLGFDIPKKLISRCNKINADKVCNVQMNKT